MAAGNKTRDFPLPCIDGALAAVCLSLSFIVRLDPGPALGGFLPQMVLVASIAAFLKPAMFAALGLYSIYWRYVGPAEVRRVFGASVTGSIAVAAVVALLQSPFAWLRGIPTAVFLVDFLAMTLGLGLVRFAANSRMAELTRG